MIGTFLSTVIFLEAGPTALEKIRWWYYVMFIGLTVINIAVMWRWFPEVKLWIKDLPESGLTHIQTKGLSLEEINGLFGDEVAIHFSDIQRGVILQDQRPNGTVANEGKVDTIHLEDSSSSR